ncbi:MAG: hypothetical protein ABI543_14095 [Ignavibacteria bacterium]
MKVPTYHKFGLTKAQLQIAESRDKKISDILTHHLTIGIGLAFGLVLYILYFNKVRPDSFIQIVVQIFLFGSIGIICVGIPALLFKLAEMFYFKQKEKTDEHQTITRYNQQRDTYDFWKIRKDYGFWNMMDGLSFEKEVMSLYLHLGYEDMEELASEEFPDERILKFVDKCYYFSFYTKILEFKNTEEIDKLLIRKENSKCDFLNLYSAKGFSKKVIEYVKEKPVNLFDINGIIKVVRTVKEI